MLRNQKVQFAFIIMWLHQSTLGLKDKNTNSVYGEWSCLNNYKCVKDIEQNVLDSLRNNRSVQVGAITIEPVPSTMSKSMKLSAILPKQKFKLKLGKYTLAMRKSEDGKYAKVEVNFNNSGNITRGTYNDPFHILYI